MPFYSRQSLNLRLKCVLSIFTETDVETDNEKYAVDTNKEFSCSIIQINSGKNLDDTIQYIENLVKFLEPNMAIKFTEMVCDFIKDESDIWWMIRVVAFKTDPP